MVIMVVVVVVVAVVVMVVVVVVVAVVPRSKKVASPSSWHCSSRDRRSLLSWTMSSS